MEEKLRKVPTKISRSIKQSPRVESGKMRNITQDELQQKLDNLINADNVKLYDEEKGRRLYSLLQKET